MQRQTYRDRSVALTKIAYFGPLGAKLRFAATFSLVSAKFCRFWKHRFFAKRGRDTEKHKNDDGCGTRIFFRNPDFDLHVADLRPTM